MHGRQFFFSLWKAIFYPAGNINGQVVNTEVLSKFICICGYTERPSSWILFILQRCWVSCLSRPDSLKCRTAFEKSRVQTIKKKNSLGLPLGEVAALHQIEISEKQNTTNRWGKLKGTNWSVCPCVFLMQAYCKAELYVYVFSCSSLRYLGEYRVWKLWEYFYINVWETSFSKYLREKLCTCFEIKCQLSSSLWGWQSNAFSVPLCCSQKPLQCQSGGFEANVKCSFCLC